MKFFPLSQLLLLLFLHICFPLVSLEEGREKPVVRYFRQNVINITNLALSDIELAERLEAFQPDGPDPELEGLITIYLEDFKESNGVEKVGHVDPDRMLANPIAVYRLMRRRVSTWHKIVQHGKLQNLLKGLSRRISDHQSGRDVADAIKGILNIQLYYDFNVSQFAEGNILGTRTNAKLRGIHCVEIGSKALHRYMFAAAIDWFREGKLRGVNDGTVPQVLAEKKISRAIRLHDETWFNVMARNKNEFIEPKVNLYSKPLGSVSIEDNTRIRDIAYKQLRGNVSSILLNSFGLCAGENLQSYTVKSRLFCWREFKVHPFYNVGPLQMEFLDRNPDILLVHQAFFKADVEEMKQSPGSLVPSEDGAEQLGVEVDVRLGRKIGNMLGLKLAMGSEDVGWSLMYRYCDFAGLDILPPHVDGNGDINEMNDDLGTALIYLNKVEQGGHTALLPSLSFAKPEEGSLLWHFRMLADSSKDRATLHFACPPVIGQKWTIIRRALLSHQFPSLKCPLHSKDRFQVQVNGKFLPIPQALQNRLRKEDELTLEASVTTIASFLVREKNKDVLLSSAKVLFRVPTIES